VNLKKKGGGRMEQTMTLEEQKQVLIDAYVNLMRIKSFQKEENKELEYQIKVAKAKLSNYSVDISQFEY
jgi:hypothetical protein